MLLREDNILNLHVAQVQTISFGQTRSYAALRAADLGWIVGPGYSSGGYILEKNHEKNNLQPWKTMKNQPGTMKNHENRPGTMKNQPSLNKNVTNAGSQLAWEGGRAGINKNVTDKQNLPIIYRYSSWDDFEYG